MVGDMPAAVRDVTGTHSINWDHPRRDTEERTIWQCDRCGDLAIKYKDGDIDWYGAAASVTCHASEATRVDSGYQR